VNRDEFAAAVEEAFDGMIAPLTRLSGDLVTQPLAEGKRSLKELAAHLVRWDKITVRALEACFRGESFDWQTCAESDSLNAQTVADAEAAPHTRVAAEWQITHTTVMEALRRVPDQRLLEGGEIPRWLIEKVLDHYGHHAAEVKAWMEKLNREGGPGLEELTVLR
jgi:uncharacterized damage-inducible protein DinB